MRPFTRLAKSIATAACVLLVWAAAQSAYASTPPHDAIRWLRSDTAAFAQARAQHRYVILYLEAVWCHWCHVIDEKTYGDAAVREEIAAHYVPLRIDQDLRPDLSNRYKDYGWPATIVFAPNGSEIIKRQGFIEPAGFLKLLRAIEADPSPENAATVETSAPAQISAALAPATRDDLIKRHRDTFDAQLGGLALEQKYLDRDSVEYALAHAGTDASEKVMAITTLDAARALFDPIWGGVYQYSTFSDWKHPHYEKLAVVQAEYLRIYALAWAQFGRAEDKAAAGEIRRYIDAFLRSPHDAFYVSQDADIKPGEHASAYFALADAGRRAQGVPRVDKHLYTLQNGLLIEALAGWAEVSGDADALHEAQHAADWIIANRHLPGGGFRHDEQDAAGPYLGDTLAMGRAFLALYRATAERAWLARTGAALDFIETHFKSKQGYASAQSSGPIAATAQTAENIALARYANLAARYTGKDAHRAVARHALAYLAQSHVALESITEPGILLADEEMASDPVHLTVVGGKSDPSAKLLFAASQRLPGAYKRIEWWDQAEGALPHPDVSYPPVKRAAAFVCTENRCSLPIYKAEEIPVFLAESAKTATQ
ncbi:MAG: thioredoxin domain-containing protein [Gammaproteobacteria bacterium]|nr:MAG: thioredoxin domain-containing protein [Gammaproteobacteria bacterium]